MDSKERFLVDELCRRITQQIFHERDVLALLILLRGHSAADSPVRELADFIAHREKDRGALKKYVQHVVAYGQALANGTAGQLKIEPVFTSAAFRDSLNAVLAGLSIPVFPNERSDDVLACTMSLLQDVRVFHEKKEIGRLGLSRFAGDLWLHGSVIMEPKGVQVVFPALIVPNRYCAPVVSRKPSPRFFHETATIGCPPQKLRPMKRQETPPRNTLRFGRRRWLAGRGRRRPPGGRWGLPRLNRRAQPPAWRCR